MRKYPQNSPQAAARILSLTLIADGDVNNAEFALLDQLAMHEQLGLGPGPEPVPWTSTPWPR